LSCVYVISILKKTHFYIFLIIVLAAVCHAQNDRELRLEARMAMTNKDWFGAAQYYNRMFNRDSSDIKLKFNYAEACRLNFDIDIAIRLYNKVIAVDNGKKYPMSLYWMGQLLKTKGQYKEAKKWFAKFSKIKIKKNNSQLAYYVAKSKLEIEACDLAQLMVNSPVIALPEHLDKTINSKVSEYAPFEKDSTLYFSSLRDNSKKEPNSVSYNKIYRSEIKNNKWRAVKALDTNINSTYLHNANTAFSPDDRQIIVSRCQSKNATEYRCDLYFGNYINNQWQPLEKMAEPINMPGVNTSQPCFGEINGKIVLFFTSDRAGGEGGLDIWFSTMNSDGSYAPPVNAGKLVNTPEDEITPWYVSVQKTLYFSSTYHKGLGGFDIFKSELIDSVFTQAQNPGYPINSSYNDVYYSLNKSGDRVYLSSNRVGSFFENKLNCCNDIYRFAIDPIVEPPKPIAIDTAALVRGQLKLLVPLTLYFHNDQPDPRTMNTTTTKNYETSYREYKNLLPQYLEEYSLGLDKEQKQGAGFKIENFFSDSLDAGFDDLGKFIALLEKVLQKGDTVKITMKGYCSPLASSEYNINLAKRRISSLRNYFMETGNAVLTKYINNESGQGGKIIFEDVEVGELPASKVSDDFKDKKNSIYSPFAASERKIQIIAVSFGK
jgi:tetratricopeptide (TPR) repeat protein